MRPTAHRQVLRNPFQAHRGLFSEPRGQPHFPFISLARLAQGALVPSQTAHLLPQQTQRTGLLRFPPFRPIMGGPQPNGKMIAHQAGGVNLPCRLAASLGQGGVQGVKP